LFSFHHLPTVPTAAQQMARVYADVNAQFGKEWCVHLRLALVVAHEAFQTGMTTVSNEERL